MKLLKTLIGLILEIDGIELLRGIVFIMFGEVIIF
jgi:hypothetical protein